MLLADRLVAQLHGSTGEAGDTYQRLIASARFAFDDKTSLLAADAVIRPEDVARIIPLPAASCWIELALPDTSVGILIRADDETLRHGRGLLVRLPNKANVLSLSTCLIDMDGGGIIGADHATAKSLLGAVAMLATPALCQKRDVDMSRLNKHRDRKGKPPLLSHKAITIDLGRQSSGTSTVGDGHSRRHHFVRAFLRFRLGGMELVRPHWRGDATRGVAQPHFRVTA